MERPKFVIKNRFQKGGLYQDLLKPSTLAEICNKLTGISAYNVSYEDEINEGQLAELHFNDTKFYIFLFQKKDSRNACFQSFPTALLKSLNDNSSAGIFSYFLPLNPNDVSKIETDYFKFMYRLMKTVGTNFINENILSNRILPFNSIEDIILGKNNIRGNNRANKSTYITESIDNTIQVYGKLYGANKYETVLLCYALNKVTISPIKVYEIKEGNLERLPGPSRAKLISLGIDIETVDLTIERAYFDSEQDNLRSPRYNYNLLERFGDKKCALCNCDVPQIIQGAHIYPVADIKRENHLTIDEKLALALDGNNGLWLCSNHHKLFDSNIITINSFGGISYSSLLNETQSNFIKETTTNPKLSDEILNDDFINYLEMRNRNITGDNYITI